MSNAILKIKEESNYFSTLATKRKNDNNNQNTTLLLKRFRKRPLAIGTWGCFSCMGIRPSQLKAILPGPQFPPL